MAQTLKQRFEKNIGPANLNQFTSMGVETDLYTIFEYYAALQKFKLFYGVCRQLAQISSKANVVKRAVELWLSDVSNNDAQQVYITKGTVLEEFGGSIADKAPFETTENPHHRSQKIMYLYSLHICQALLDESNGLI